MITKYPTTTSLLTVALVVTAVLVGSSLALSIEREPVKVTHRNSGPKYEIDEVERTKLTSSSSSAGNDNNQRQPASDSNNEETATIGERQPPVDEPIVPMGHVSIRRIFLVPMNPDSAPDHSDEQQGTPFMPRPFWPFSLAPARPMSSGHRHLFGTDEASRSPTTRDDDDNENARERPRLAPGSSGEREEEHESAPGGLAARPIFDPIQMMVDMMQQALNGQLMPPVPPAGTSDLNKDASSSPSSSSPDDVNSKPTGDIDRSMRPQSQNETKEDIVEIEGKKYLRKTVINRHVGENIIFMTKRLIFVPLNETDSATTTTTTTTTTTEATSPSTTLRPSEEATPTPASSPVDKESAEMPVRPTSSPKEETSPTTTAATSTTTTISETPEARTDEPATAITTSEPATSAQPSTSESTAATSPAVDSASSTMAEKPEEMTTTEKSSWVDRVSDAIDKAAERIVERTSSSSSSTERPSTTVSP